MTKEQNELLDDCIHACLTLFNAIDSHCETCPELEDVAEGLAITHTKLIVLQQVMRGTK